MQLSPQQDQAALAVQNWLRDPSGKRFFYLAGYAGTGKTTLAKILAENVRRVRFAAFTGKAALVLASKDCDPSSTIHSLIYKVVRDGSGRKRFVLNMDSDILGCDLLIVDEISMVGEKIGNDLLKFGVRILVLGDPAQLPPIKSAGFFTSNTPDFMLTEIHRQARDNPIIRMSMDVREGNELQFGEYGDSRVIRRNQMSANMALDADILITGKNDTRRQWNRRMRELKGREGRFCVGERVVSLKNNAENGLLNGALWDVSEVGRSNDPNTTHLKLSPVDAFMAGLEPEIITHHDFLEKDEKKIPDWMKSEFDPVDYGYALSCHKSQGSQWGSTLIYDESWVFRENATRWLYTAITRAAERTIIVR